MHVVLSIAGSDPTGGAGIQGDLKTLEALGVYGTAVITAVTVQNSAGVTAIHSVPGEIIEQQIVAVCDEFTVEGVKIGMLPTVESVDAVVRALSRQAAVPVVVDPVMRASAGQELAGGEVVAAMQQTLFSRATLITPNLEEATILASMQIDSLVAMQEAASRLSERHGCAVLITGGHATFALATDMLVSDGSVTEFPGTAVTAFQVHGAGCALSSAIAAHLAAGVSLVEAVRCAKDYVGRAIAAAEDLGGARRPLNARRAFRQ